MTIDIHALLEKNPNTKAMLRPKFGYRFLGPFNNLQRQILYDKQTGDILKYYQLPKNILDKIASRHDTCYATINSKKNKNDCDRIMVRLKKLIIFLMKNDLGDQLRSDQL